MGESVSFHTFTLPEDGCVRLLVKNLGKEISESVVREELETLGIHVQAVMQLRSGRRYRDPAKDRPLTPTSMYPWRGGLKCPRCDLSPNYAVCECRWSLTWLPRVPCNANAASASDTRSVTADTRPSVSRVVALTSPVGVQTRENSLSAVAAGATTQRVTGAVLSGKKRGQHLQSERQKVSGRAPLKANPPLLKPSGPGPLWSRQTWARAEFTSSEGACCQGHHHSTKS